MRGGSVRVIGCERGGERMGEGVRVRVIEGVRGGMLPSMM